MKGADREALTPKELKIWLCGTYVSYRYSYEESAQNRVAREVMRVREHEGRYEFTLWYSRGGSREDRKIERFNGVVVPIGRSLFFTGASGDRGRSLLMRQETDVVLRPASRMCRIGIMTSSKVRGDASPVAACAVMLKLRKEPVEFEARYCTLDANVVGVSPCDQILQEDFIRQPATGERAEINMATYHRVQPPRVETFDTWMKIFMNNEPLTPISGVQMAVDDQNGSDGSDPLDDATEKRDSILRLHLHRFYPVMSQIHTTIENDRDRMVPFKDNWRLRPAAP